MLDKWGVSYDVRLQKRGSRIYLHVRRGGGGPRQLLSTGRCQRRAGFCSQPAQLFVCLGQYLRPISCTILFPPDRSCGGTLSRRWADGGRCLGGPR